MDTPLSGRSRATSQRSGMASLSSSSSSGSSSSSSSRRSSDSLSLPSPAFVPRLTPPGSPQDTFGGHTPLDPSSGRSTSLVTTGTAGSRPSPLIGGASLPSLQPGTSRSTIETYTSSLSAYGSASSPPPPRSGSSPSASASASTAQTGRTITPATRQTAHPSAGSFGQAAGSAVAAAMAATRSRSPALSQDSEPEPPSQRSSWIINPVSPNISQAAIAVARKQRITDRPQLPTALPPLSPRALSSVVETSSSAAGSGSGSGAASAATAAAATAAAASGPANPRPSTSAVGGTGPASVSSSSLQPPPAAYNGGGAPQSPASSLFSRHSRASLARARASERSAWDHSTDEPLPSPLGAMSFASTTFPSMSPRGTPTESINRDLPPLPGELPLPHYSFLDEDPAIGGADSPLSARGGVSHFSGSGNGASGSSGPGRRVSAQSVPVSEPPRLKHLSATSAFSDLYPADSSSGPADAARSEPNAPASRTASGRFARWSSFAGGPPPAWGRRDSVRSIRSNKSSKSTRSKKRSSKHASLAASSVGGGHDQNAEIMADDWAGDDESVDLLVLVRRAALLERLLRAGKRASGIANPRRISSMTSSTRYSGITSSRQGYSHNVSRSRTSPSPPPGHSTSGSQRRSVQSTAGSIKHRLAQRLGLGPSRPFAGLGSDDGEGTEEPTPTTEESFVDIGSSDHTSYSSHFLPPPGTPPRRAVSTSFTRRDPELALAGQGSGVIVFPELATMPPLEPMRHDGEVCAQSCLPPSVAIPYTPLKPPPPTQQVHTSRSLHSLRNLRFVDEKNAYHGIHFAKWNSASGPTRSSRFSRNSSMLIGDVPACDDTKLTPSQRRLKIVLIIVSLLIIGLLVGILAGFLTHRERHRKRT